MESRSGLQEAMRLSGLAVVVALMFSGCSADGSTEVASPSPTATSAAPLAIVEDDMKACAIAAETLTPVADMMTALVADGGTTLDPLEVSAQADLLRDMLDVSTARMDAYAAPYASVVLLVDDIFEGRADGGSQTMNTGAYRDGAIGLLTYCVDTVGYTEP